VFYLLLCSAFFHYDDHVDLLRLKSFQFLVFSYQFSVNSISRQLSVLSFGY
jgi:hypothetical protein